MPVPVGGRGKEEAVGNIAVMLTLRKPVPMGVGLGRFEMFKEGSAERLANVVENPVPEPTSGGFDEGPVPKTLEVLFAVGSWVGRTFTV